MLSKLQILKALNGKLKKTDITNKLHIVLVNLIYSAFASRSFNTLHCFTSAFSLYFILFCFFFVLCGVLHFVVPIVAVVVVVVAVLTYVRA